MTHQGSRAWEAPLGNQELTPAEAIRAQVGPFAGSVSGPGSRSARQTQGGL